ncbi:putative beta-mannosidase [Mytilinidion resinicola]|uniref:Beta-mannosidase A n=1 Tax=Mytilinidion resinicola TaxID=574789 RepID=A0A6A6YYF1_9PEZI|nr:putative beta-mannosidase [Mytilinidion resinicola]KAF2813578.1 putative beta-mannosidase [Mytilinidion resinicola]
MRPRSTQAVLAASFAAAGSCHDTYCQQNLNLSTVSWTVSNPNGSVSVPGKFPSQAHIDLYAAGVIPWPLYGLGDFDLRWVAYSNWTYTSEALKGLRQDADSTWLLFNGLDTFASIEFCGKHVAATNNQFRQYYFDVTSLLKECKSNPVLSINFGSAPNIADAIAAEPGQETWPFGVEINYEFLNRQFIRKEQSDFGWDWGPAFAPVGPWLPGSIVQLAASEFHIRNSLVDIYREGQLNLLPPDQSRDWVVKTSLDVFGKLPSDASLTYSLQDASGKTVGEGRFENVTSDSSTITGSVVIPADSVNLWWPVGMGPQTLYSLKIAVDSNGRTVNEVTKRVGFRTIVSNQGPITQEQLDMGIAPGNNWHFEINGHEFYAKGSNLIPPDVFWANVTEARIKQLFDSVVIGNQNMLRVWSSGAYSPDFMYDLADEMGILLWSEFEFGDALYPVEKEFLDNVKDEVYYQVRRINHHPSLAYWAGGNELENLELYVVENAAPKELDRYTAEYETLFLDTIVPILFGNSRSISYSPSSTSNGYLELDFSLPQPITERYNNKTPGSIYGETDHYDYDSTVAFDISSYPIGRFANEFGFHSMPSLESWQQQIDPADLYFNSSTIVLRNHHYPPMNTNTSNYANSTKGMVEMTLAVERWYPAPQKEDPIANFSAWCHATQIFQADYYSSQIQYYRSGSGRRERQLGSLYWQLEDQWQAPTWAGIEYDGRWKVLHYVARDIYQPVIVSPFFNATTKDFEVWVTSDLWSSVKGAVNLTWYDWSGKRLDIATPVTLPVTVGAINSTKVLQTNTNDILKNHDPLDVVLAMSVSVEGQLPSSNTTQTLTHTNWFHAAPLSVAHIVDPGLKITPGKDSFTIEATTGVAAWVWLDHSAGVMGYFDSNAFWLAPGEKKEVGFTVTGGEWIDGTTVQSLWDLTLP